MTKNKSNPFSPPLALWGVILMGTGALLATIVVFCWNIAYWMSFGINLNYVYHFIFWVTIIGNTFFWIDFLFLMPRRRKGYELKNDVQNNPRVTVVLTAFNDEKSIASSVEDFKKKAYVNRIIVIDNNSKDNTYQQAQFAGAEVFTELRQGYGACVYRGLVEGARVSDSDIIALCEGDLTFRADDLDKMITYLPHADVVNGTRIVEQLRQPKTQLTNFMYFGNFFAAKILELKHFGKGTLTDLGTTYKLIKMPVLRQALPSINAGVNLEYNAYFLDIMLKEKYKIVECPITFHERVGLSKGGNRSNTKAVSVGVRMLIGIIFSWKLISRGKLSINEDI